MFLVTDLRVLIPNYATSLLPPITYNIDLLCYSCLSFACLFNLFMFLQSSVIVHGAVVLHSQHALTLFHCVCNFSLLMFATKSVLHILNSYSQICMLQLLYCFCCNVVVAFYCHLLVCFVVFIVFSV